MHSSSFYLAVATFTSVAVNAHGKIAVAVGDAGGNTTALGIMGAAVPGMGRNKETEVDTTVFQRRDAASDGLGHTKGNGENNMGMMDSVMAMSGSTLPQVSSNGGHIAMTYHIVTTDGAGPLRAIVDPTATGQFSQGQEADVVTQVPGRNGNIQPGPLSNNMPAGGKGGILGGLGLRGLTRRALNVNTDHPLQVAIPAGTTCTGAVGGMQNVCLMKVANPSGAGPFGGVIAFQMAPEAPAAAQIPNAAAPNSAAPNAAPNAATAANSINAPAGEAAAAAADVVNAEGSKA
ncbi:uncharacterized protein LMH87_008371 [Akanthomyces muscarius]|uniref:CAS1 appressorium specific protein n=1 Tax=Akanthomyces muscarius TaxID=2231603 RepID=A0A9W8QJK0_AKAMU|nr:uncharacterized protein LMH87_008371 [Akanthomyces muscarius]KAJ4159471.1 hypothetical protein LMH87_008371 [Akanthomyces muscarius]